MELLNFVKTYIDKFVKNCFNRFIVHTFYKDPQYEFFP